MAEFHLAQVNIAEMRVPLEHPSMADFVALLEPTNRLAESSEGFVWRYTTDEGDETVERVFGSSKLLFNMSVWTSVEALENYVFKSDHVQVLRRSAEWFDPASRPTMALWWIEAGTLPSVEDAKARLEQIVNQGPTQRAFTFRERFDP